MESIVQYTAHEAMMIWKLNQHPCKTVSTKTDKYNFHEGIVQRFLLDCISCS